jgi:ferredoxin
MIYASPVFLLLLTGFVENCEGLHTSSSFLRRVAPRLNAVPEWTTGDGSSIADEFEVPMVTVRFINTLGGKDVVTVVEQGSNLLFVGDQAGVKLPRSCRTGLCASCTCEVQDPLAIATPSNPRDGFATIRACSTKCFVPGGMNEMVVDVYRMQNRAPVKSRGETSNAGVAAAAFEAYVRRPYFSSISDTHFTSAINMLIVSDRGLPVVELLHRIHF